MPDSAICAVFAKNIMNPWIRKNPGVHLMQRMRGSNPHPCNKKYGYPIAHSCDENDLVPTPIRAHSQGHGFSHGLKIARQLSIFAPVYALVPSFRILLILCQKENPLRKQRASFWQRMRDSNPRKRSQSPVCYRYTNPLSGEH